MILQSSKETLSTSNIEYVVHISDVHIRNVQRHAEYTEVFERVYKLIDKLIQEKGPNGLIYLGGDIVHAKLDMSPELVQAITEFFVQLANRLPVVLITGNHDCNLRNTNRLDALTPIVKSIDLMDTAFEFYYLPNSGIYTYGDIDFIVWSVFDEPSNYILPKDVQTNNKKVVLFHGAVTKATTDGGIEIRGDVEPELFDGCYAGLLGDIHRYQFLDDDKTVAYPGSLIQQNHGEGLRHGILVWDFTGDKPSHEFHKIKNDYGYITIEIEGGVVKDMPRNIPKKPRIRLKVSDTKSSELSSIIADLKTNHNLEDIRIQSIPVVSSTNSSASQIQKSISGIRVPTHQNQLIEDYLTRVKGIDDEELIADVCKLNEEINKQLSDDQSIRNIVWRPIKFKFSNMFSYGENNVVHFDNMNGIYGLFAPNASGKSSVFDAIMFTIFDKCSRTYKASQVMNNKSDEFTSMLELDISGKTYRIYRDGARDKRNNVKVDARFVLVEADGSETELSGEDRDETNKVIRSYLGTYDDFVLTAMSLQNASSNFIDKSQRERKDLLAQFMDIGIFDELYRVGNDQLKDTKAVLKSYIADDYETQLQESMKIVKESKELLATIESDLEVNRLQRQNMVKEISKLENEVGGIDEDFLYGFDVDDESARVRQLENSIEAFSADIETAKTELAKSIEVAKLLESKIDAVEVTTEMRSASDNMIQCKNELDVVIQEMTRKESLIGQYDDSIRHLSEHEYDPECEYCVKNVFVQEAMKAQEQKPIVEKELDELAAKKKSLHDRLEEYSRLNSQYNDYLSDVSDLDSLKSMADKKELLILKLESKKSDAVKEHNEISENLARYFEIRSTIEQNKQLENDLKKKRSEMEDLDSDNVYLETERIRLVSQSSKAEATIEMCNEKKNKVVELERSNAVIDLYVKSVHRNGVPNMLITDILPYLESEANLILSDIVEFKVLFETDGKNILTYIVYDDDKFWPLELASGMERFISSLAIRTALIKITSLPRPNFIAIDEGFGVADSNNLANISSLFDYLKTQFDFVMVVSHIDSMRDMVEYTIDIDKEHGFSTIVY